MSEDITIRMASRVDISALAKMQLNSWLTDVHKKNTEVRVKRFFFSELKKRWKQRLEKNLKVLVLELQSEIIGFIAFNHFNVDSNECVEVANIYVRPDLRRQGLGRSLCMNMLETTSDAKLISVWILDADCITKTFYESLGFKPTKEIRCDQFGTGMTLKEIRFQLSL